MQFFIVVAGFVFLSCITFPIWKKKEKIHRLDREIEEILKEVGWAS